MVYLAEKIVKFKPSESQCENFCKLTWNFLKSLSHFFQNHYHFSEQNKKSKKIETVLFSILQKYQQNKEIRYFSGNSIAFLHSNHSNFLPDELKTQLDQSQTIEISTETKQIDFIGILLATNKFGNIHFLF